MDSPTQIKLQSPAEFLSLVPALVGFEPSESLVCVAFRGGRTHGAVRLDLEGFRNPPTRDEATAVALGTITRIPRITGVAVVVYTDEASPDGAEPPCAEVVRKLAETITSLDLDLVDQLWRSATAWGSYDDPTQMHSLDELKPPAHAPAIKVLDIAAETELPVADPEHGEAVTRAAARIREDVREEPSSDEPFHMGACDLLDPVGLGEQLASLVDADAVLGVEDYALVTTMLESGGLRDVMTYSWAWGAGAAAHLWSRLVFPEQFATADEEDPWMYALAGRIEVRPETARLRRAITLLKQVSCVLEEEDRAPAFTVISWCYWALGLASIADVWLRRATAAEPTYSLANIMRMLLQSCVMPDWAFYDSGEVLDDEPLSA